MATLNRIEGDLEVKAIKGDKYRYTCKLHDGTVVDERESTRDYFAAQAFSPNGTHFGSFQYKGREDLIDKGETALNIKHYESDANTVETTLYTFRIAKG